jgi:L-asparagine transporter-like permease
MVFFAFQGIEFVSITIGETKEPRTVLKKAINETLFRILIFYIGALVVIMSIIPWRSLTASQSPFVQVFQLAGLPAAAAVINFVVLTAAASALNSVIFSCRSSFLPARHGSVGEIMGPPSFWHHFQKRGSSGGHFNFCRFRVDHANHEFVTRPASSLYDCDFYF